MSIDKTQFLQQPIPFSLIAIDLPRIFNMTMLDVLQKNFSQAGFPSHYYYTALTWSGLALLGVFCWWILAQAKLGPYAKYRDIVRFLTMRARADIQR